jgi:MoaA/NifB/PqqE/SkfB family radical SAM enzyme
MQGGKVNPFITLDEITIEQFKEWFPISFVKQLKKLFMCGNLGDPIVAKDTLEIFKYLREHNNSMMLHMHTNGSGRNVKWWTELASLDVFVIFGIDGLGDTHSLYRVGTDFDIVIRNAKSFIRSGGNAEWVFIKFKHNEHQVTEAASRSDELGFESFTLKNSSRFILEPRVNVVNRDGQVTHYIEPPTELFKPESKKCLPL